MARLSVAPIYDAYGSFYDHFEIFFQRRIARALAPIPFQPGDQVLDVGVGTGFSLRHFPEFVHVTGIDNSIQMLSKANERVYAGQVPAITRLLRADAMDLPFSDKAFDVVVLSHVISTVADPDRCIAEALRVTRDRGIVVMVNHFRSTNAIVRWLEETLDPLCRKLGWQNNLSLIELLARAGVQNPSHTQQTRGRLFQTVYLQRNGATVKVVTLPDPVEMNAQFNPA